MVALYYRLDAKNVKKYGTGTIFMIPAPTCVCLFINQAGIIEMNQ